MRTHRHDPVAIPLGHVERPRPIVGHVSPDPVPHDVAVDWSALDTPTVLRSRRSLRWQDEPEEIRAEVKQAAIEQLTLRLQTAKRIAARNPELSHVETVDRIERALEAARRL